MRLLIIGTDDDGRSAIDRIEALDEGAEGASRGSCQPKSGPPRRRVAHSRTAPFGPPPTARLPARRGQLAVRAPRPGASIDLHRTDSIDCDTVLGDTSNSASRPAACCSSQATWCSSLGSPTAGCR